MSMLPQLAYDVDNVIFGGDWDEAADYSQTGLSEPLRVRALWGIEERDSERAGLVANWRTVHVPAADLVDLGEAVSTRRRDAASLIRYPDDLDRQERWTIADVRLADGIWHFECFRLGRGSPREAIG